MKNLTIALLTASVLAGAANADVVTGKITADNHYALYSSVGDVFAYHGGNELGAGGSEGGYNWSNAESYSFQAGDYLYIAAWSDDSVAQGVLAEFHSDGLGTILSGDSRWQVFGTGVNLGDGDAHPDASFIGTHVMNANANNLWEEIFSGGTNGISPWGEIAGIDKSSKWMWHGAVGDDDPTQGGSGANEMLIFRTVVPTPSSLALVGMGGIAAIRRRRR